MSFLYPRCVSFHRPAAQFGVGARPYGGQVAEEETPIDKAKDIPASIQGRREGTNNPVGLPGDAYRATWYVFIPKHALANGVLKSRDIMVDELGVRYQILMPYWDSLGYRLSVVSLEA